MDSAFIDMGSDFLAHHGVDGQKWGVQNGPPYPLDSDGKAALRAQRKEAAAEKKRKHTRQSILKDPKKIVKYQDDFTKEEIDEALAKIQSIQKAKSMIPTKKAGLTAAQKRWAKDPALMLKNFDKFRPEQLKLALDAERDFRELKNRRVEKANLPKKWVDLGLGYVQSFIHAGKSLMEIMDLDAKLSSYKKGLTLDDSYKLSTRNKTWKDADGTIKDVATLLKYAQGDKSKAASFQTAVDSVDAWEGKVSEKEVEEYIEKLKNMRYK